MAKGGGKGAGAKAAKSAHEEDVKLQQQKEKEAAEEAKWADGAKESKASKKEKADKLAAAKAERDRLLKEEEENETKKASTKATKSGPKPAKKSTPGPSAIPEFSARNIDDALDLLEIANDKTDKASMGAKAAKGVDAHPERRFKAAFEEYKENELPNIKKEHPGLRLQQYHDLLYKQFQKHPSNPFNQVTVSYDATKDVKVAALQNKKKVIEERLQSN